MNKWSCGSTTRLPKWLKMASHYLSAVVDAMCERARYLNPFPCWTFSKETDTVSGSVSCITFFFITVCSVFLYFAFTAEQICDKHTPPTLLPDAALIVQHSDLTSSF